MPSSYSGNPLAVPARAATTVINISDTDALNSANLTSAAKTLADQVAMLMQNAALIGLTQSNPSPLNLDSGGGDVNPGTYTAAVPTARKLLGRYRSSTGVFTRLYVESDGETDPVVGAGFSLVTNAGWNGTSWVADKVSLPASILRIGRQQLQFASTPAAGMASPVDDATFVTNNRFQVTPQSDALLKGWMLGSNGASVQMMGPGASGYACHEDFHYVGYSGQPAFAAGWANASGQRSLCFWKDAFGVVHVEGTATGNTGGTNSLVFTLPVNYRPSARVCFAIGGAATIYSVLIDSTGQVLVAGSSGVSNQYFQCAFHPDVVTA